jgi:hypothetical protein
MAEGEKLQPAQLIAALEQQVYARSPQAFARLLDLLFRFATGRLGLEAEVELHATRLAAAIGPCLLEPSLKLEAADAERLALVGRALHNLFSASAFGTTDHLLEALGARDTESLARLAKADRNRYAKALALLTIDSALPIEAEALLAGSPRQALLAFLNLLGSKPITTLAGQARRERLLEAAAKLPAADIPRGTDFLVLLTNAWMLCSYAEGRGKHAIKPVLNRVLRDWAKKGGMSDAALPAKRALVERPKLLVAAEIMQSNHVQYRYFGQYLRQLRTKFRLELLTEEKQVDEPVRALYDAVHVYKRSQDGSTIAEAAALIKRLAPDVIFWLSVGMRHWGPPLANLRLAPIQLAGLGHSASTFCDTVDYYFTEEGYVGDPSLFGEQLVLLPDASLVFERSPHYAPVAPRIRAEARPLRVALPSNLLKLNPAFIAVLRRIRAAAKRPLEFRVFPNVSGLELDATRRTLARELPGARVFEMMRYQPYLERLADCDLNLSPFPFGGLHSVVDSLRQGVPVVAMEGLEPHARTDAMLLRRLGMPEWLVTKDVEGYVAAALRVIDDDRTRVALARQAAALDIDRVLYGDAGTPLRSEVVDALWWVYRHHEAIKASGRKAFRAADWRRDGV